MAADLQNFASAGNHSSAMCQADASCGHCEDPPSPSLRTPPSHAHLDVYCACPTTGYPVALLPVCSTRIVATQDVAVADASPLPLRPRRNSELYNHEALRKQHLAGVDLGTTSDSAIVGHMYARMGDGDDLWNSLDGIFACVVLDEQTGDFCAARDAMGVCSFYWGRGADGSTWFASELKALQDNCETFECFLPVRAPQGSCLQIIDTACQCLDMWSCGC